MDQTILPICIDDYIDGEEFDPANFRRPVGFQSTNPRELALEKDKLWEVGQELRIRFLDGTPALHTRVIAIASQWLDYANLIFTFGNHADAEIRITFKGYGYSSLVGTDALRRPDQKIATMTLAGFREDSDEEELRRVVLHEFGHAIGCVHEQANPSVDIPWNPAKVYPYYAAMGWTKAMVDRNLFMRYKKTELEYSNHDPLSIMHYPISKEHTFDGFEVGWNRELSAGDKAFIASIYPFPEHA